MQSGQPSSLRQRLIELDRAGRKLRRDWFPPEGPSDDDFRSVRELRADREAQIRGWGRRVRYALEDDAPTLVARFEAGGDLRANRALWLNRPKLDESELARYLDLKLAILEVLIEDLAAAG